MCGMRCALPRSATILPLFSIRCPSNRRSPARMLDKNEAWQRLGEADLVCSAQEVGGAIERVAAEVTARLADANPLVLSVMGGAVVFTGRLLPLLPFPLELDYLHVTRYDGKTRGSEVRW